MIELSLVCVFADYISATITDTIPAAHTSVSGLSTLLYKFEYH